MKRLAVFGSTGSIGTQTLDVVRREKEAFSAEILIAGTNYKLMEEQMREFHPRKVVMGDESAAASLKELTRDLPIPVESGMEAVIEAAADPDLDMCVMGLVGMIGIRPTIAAIRAGHTLALANKETLVCAGHLIMKLAKEHHVDILPVDSEHSAIFQCIGANPEKDVEKILLTASGGPFFGKDTAFLSTVRPEDALKHPNWSMGTKVTIDSASMVNKGLEVMEARWLFDREVDDIQVLVQRQSLVHSMVQFRDGSVMAQIASPDMRVPISYALAYPEHVTLPIERVDFAKIGSISFHDPDMETFRGLKLGYDAGRKGGSLPTVFNAANERAVKLFIAKKISFTDIYDLLEDCMGCIPFKKEPSLEEIFEIEQSVYEHIDNKWG